MNKLKVKTSPQYWINKDGAHKAAYDIVSKNLHLTGDKLEDYINRYFGEIWDSYDVLQNDMVEVEQMSSFYKKLLHAFSIQI